MSSFPFCVLERKVLGNCILIIAFLSVSHVAAPIFLQVIDLLVKLLQFPLNGVPDEQNVILIFKEAYEILYTYMIGKSRKNALYFAKYIEFFQTQFTQKVQLKWLSRQIHIDIGENNDFAISCTIISHASLDLSPETMCRYQPAVFQLYKTAFEANLLDFHLLLHCSCC